ncbi:tetratricopeptide repeat protein [Streptomyces sp. NPDC054863]
MHGIHRQPGAAELREREAMEVRVLGSISAKADGQRGVEGATKTAGLLALIVTSPGCRVSSKDALRVLWGAEEVPSNRLAVLFRELRRALGDPGKHKHSGTCSLSLEWESVDYLRFREHVRRAGDLRGRECLKELREALKQWSGEEPLKGLKGEGFERLRAKLCDEWLEAMLGKLDLELEIGESGRVFKETKKVLERFPRSEEIFRRHLMAAPSSLVLPQRKKIVTEWKRQWKKGGGLPSVELTATVEAFLAAPPRLARNPLRPGTPIPRQLPSVGEGPLIGREDLLAELEDVFLPLCEKGTGLLAHFTGMAGVGKSRLVGHLAARIADHFPDGILYADLQGCEHGTRPVEPDQLLGRFLADLGVSTDASGIETKSLAFRSALAERSVLIVLDDATDADQVLPLLPGDGACTVMITSRNRLPGLHARKEVYMREIGVLDPGDAERVLSQHLSPSFPRQVGPHVLPKIAELCGGLPLALSVIEKQLPHRAPEGVRALVQRLADERTCLEELETPNQDLAVRPALGCSFSELSPVAALLLCQAAIHPGPTVSWSALMGLGRLGSGVDVGRAIVELVAANLLERVADRYRLHSLVRVYARRYAGEHVPGLDLEMRAKTVQHVADYQLHYVWACDQALVPGRELPIGDPAEAAVELCAPTEEREAMQLLDAEYKTTLDVLDLAAESGLHRHVWLLSMALVTYQWRRNLHSEAYQRLRDVPVMVQDITSPVEQAMIHRMVAGSIRNPMLYELAVASLTRAVACSERHPGREGRLSLAHSLHALGVVRCRQGDPVEAEEHHERALGLFRELGERMGEAAALNGLASIRYGHGDLDQALDLGTASLRIFVGTDDRNGTANVLSTLGKIHLARADRDAALDVYRRAVGIYRQLEYWLNEARLLHRLADVLVSAGERAEGVEALERALVLLESAEDPEAQMVADKLARLR